MGMRPPAEAVEGLQVWEVLWFGFAGLWEQQGQLRVCKRAILWSVRHRLAGPTFPCIYAASSNIMKSLTVQRVHRTSVAPYYLLPQQPHRNKSDFAYA